MTQSGSKALNNKVEDLAPVFIGWASKHGLEDTLRRFKTAFPEYFVLRLVEEYSKELEKGKEQ